MAERHPREEALRRVHGTSALFSAAYGNVGSTPYYALGVTAAFALGLTPAAFLIAGVIFVCTAATYMEGTVMHPEAGGSANFARHAFNELVSFVAGWGQMLNYIITVAISAFFVPHYLAVFWEPLGESPGDIVAGIVLIAFLAALNIKGTQESARFNLVLAVGDLITQFVLVAIGIVLVLNPETLIENVELGVAPTWGNFALGVAVGMIAYTGIETISNMAEEARTPGRTVIRGYNLTVIAVLFIYAFLPIIALSAMPVTQDPSGGYATELGTTYAGDPVLGVVENMGLSAGLTEILRFYVGILAAVILVIATNAGLIGLSRLTFSMGQYRQLPERLRQVHPRFRTPHVAILVFSGVAVLTILPGQIDFLATMYSFGAMLSFTIAHVSIARMRQRFPDRERPWMPPLSFSLRGAKLPLTAILGGIGTFAAWVVVITLDLGTLVAGATWMAIGIAVYLLYRRHQELPLRETVKVGTLTPLGVEEVEYESVVIGFDDNTPFSEEVVATAVKLAGSRRHGIHVHSMLTVPSDQPLDVKLKRQESEAASKIERAKLIGGQRVTGHVERIRRGQAGYSIAEEAAEINASAIVVGMRRRDGTPLYDETIRTVLAERPCRVIVVSEGATPGAPALSMARA
jgi:APA family basic amino acid/polyamine antiporter